MKSDRAWVLLKSSKRLNLLDPQADSWEDRDLAIGLSRTYRWGGHSRWELPLSVAQHSLLVLVLRQQMQPNAPLSRGEALRELLHDGSEGFLSFDPISPVKPHLGPAFDTLDDRLRRALETRYALPTWKEEDRVLHKRADRLAAASEALHVAGWARAELAATLNIDLAPVMNDPLPRPPGLQPWEPWPARLAASVFLRVLEHLQDDLPLTFGSDLVGQAVQREGTIASIAGAFSRLPAGPRRARCVPPTGSSLSDTFVYAEAHDGSQHAEGVVIDGDRLDDGSWDLAADFTLMTTEGDVLVCNGANCHVERQ
jgi:hypothetical protein